LKHQTIEHIETLEHWDGGTATGYFDANTNEIHVLSGKDLEYRALFHERIHASRQNKLTFKFAKIFTDKPTMSFTFGMLICLAIVGVFTSIIPFLFTAGLFSFLVLCHSYEEYVADKLTVQSCKAIKRGD
jgi:hypothetical protein